MKRAVFGFGLAGVTACSALVGVRELSVVPGDAGTAGADAAMDARADAADAADAECASEVDPANCGACGYVCPGTACTAGTCAPPLIASGPAGGRGLVLADDDFLYWAAPGDGGVVTVRKFTTAGAAARIEGPGHITAVATYRARPGEAKQSGPVIFWADSPAAATPSVRRCSTATGSCIPPPERVLAYAPALGDLSAPAPYDVCWSERGDAGAVRCLENGGAPQAIAVGIPGASPLFAVPDGNVYFGGRDGVMACPRSGCAAAPLMIATAAPVVALTVGGGGWLYFATEAGDVSRVASSGVGPSASVERVATGQGPITSLAVGDVRVYWTTLGAGPADGALVSFTLADRVVRVLARGQHAPRAVVADDLRVFWLTSGEDEGRTSVWALPR